MTVEYSNAVRPESLTYGNPGERRDVSPPVRFLSLRWLLSTGALAIVLAAGMAIALSILRQHDAIRQVEALGGEVCSRHFGGSGFQTGPEWLRRWVSHEWLRSADMAEVIWFQPDELTFVSRCHVAVMGGCPWTTGPTIDDSTLSIVGHFASVERLSLSYTNVSDAGMIHLTGLRNLQELQLEGTDISDASVPVLAGLKSLKVLLIRDTKISAAGCDELRKTLPGCDIGWKPHGKPTRSH